jgi:glycerophosphoryl diester phosphodiesterase
MGIRDIVKLKFLNLPNLKSKIVQIPETWKGLKVLSKSLLKRCKSMNLKVHVWTINHEKDMQRLIDLGVDGIMTDKPEILKNVLIKNSIDL